MGNHYKNLLLHVPDLLSRRVLDIGSGRGKFVIDMARRGAVVVGCEKYQEYIAIAEKELRNMGLEARIVQGGASRSHFPANRSGL